MCRNIRTLYNFDPPATEEEVRAASLQFVRKVSGFTRPSKANEAAFERAVEEVARLGPREIVVRGDSHYARPEAMAWLERNRVGELLDAVVVDSDIVQIEVVDAAEIEQVHLEVAVARRRGEAVRGGQRHTCGHRGCVHDVGVG